MNLEDFLTAYHLAGNTQRLRAAYRLGGVGVATKTAISIMLGIIRIKKHAMSPAVFFYAGMLLISIIGLLIYVFSHRY